MRSQRVNCMGGHEGLAQPVGFSPNGLLPNEVASMTQVLDPERWSQAEERTAELIACIQPNQPSEQRRNAVASYVQRLIRKCFSCQVFTFGSVPLKTYLPDGDIDLTAFGKNPDLKDTWANEVRDILESEEKREDAEFQVKEVQYIQAEVKIIKCLVENIVVDISFNQLGGLCTLCFLDEVDHRISQNHLFKRSIILIKAWCYYESRILGAHHGLISTYALETLVLYIFHVFNKSFSGPLEVLYRFLAFFSKFDWDNFCVSLWGPVPISSLPDMKADPPRRDAGELLLSNLFLDACSSVYAVFPGGQENQEQPFISKHFNVIDPLRINNNLGRSVSKGNFFRIRSAFSFGAQRLARLLDCPKENLIAEVNQFFMNTWDRHRKGHRPDASSPDLYDPRSVNSYQADGFDSYRNYSSRDKDKENSTSHDSEGVSSQHCNHSLRQMSKTSNTSAVSHSQSEEIYTNLTSSMASDRSYQIFQNFSSNESIHTDKDRSSRPDSLNNEVHARYQFARTQSSPELMDRCSEVPSRGRRQGGSETENGQTAPARSDNSRRKNSGPKVLDNHSARFTTEDPPSSRQSSSNRSVDAAVKSASNGYYGDSGLGTMGEDRFSFAETVQMHQEQQDLVNMMATSRGFSCNGQVQMPVNLTSAHSPLPAPPSMFASLGYAQKDSSLEVPSFESPWGTYMHYSQGLVPLPVSQYFPSVGMASNQEEMAELVDGNLVSTEWNPEERDHGFWPEPDADYVRGYDRSNRSVQARPLEDRQRFTSVRPNSVHSSRGSSSDSFSLKNHGLISEDRELIGENYEKSQYQRIRESDVYTTASLRFVSASQVTSSRTKLSSENNWEGSPSKTSKATRDGQGRKSAPSTDPSVVYGLDKNGWKFEGESVDHGSSQAEDAIREWISLSKVGIDVEESTDSESVASSRVRTGQTPGYEPAIMSGSSSILPVSPVLVSSESRQRANDNHGVLPFAFYPTGPPVPFLTMLPVYNLPNETGTSSVSRNHFDRHGELSNCQKNQLDHSLDSTGNLDQSDILGTSNSMTDAASVEPFEHGKSDILNSDFVSHWQNLQYGRFCQNARHDTPLLHPSSVVVPPMYLQGHCPWDGPERPPAANMNLFTQFFSPHLIPFSSLQPASNRPAGVHQHHANEIPRYRGGTGTYLPNPKSSFRDRQSYTKNHRVNHSYDRRDHHGDRESNWNANPKPRFAGRGQGRNQVEKPSMRADRSTASNSRSNKPCDSFKHHSFPSYYSHNGLFSFSDPTNRGSSNVKYGMYPLPVVNPRGVSSSGAAVPSVVMLYPYDQNMTYGPPAEQFEFGSLGPVHFSGMDEALHLSDVQSRGVSQQQEFQGESEHSSPDRPSSPPIHRSTGQRINLLEGSDFRHAFLNPGDNLGWSNHAGKHSHYPPLLFASCA